MPPQLPGYLNWARPVGLAASQPPLKMAAEPLAPPKKKARKRPCLRGFKFASTEACATVVGGPSMARPPRIASTGACATVVGGPSMARPLPISFSSLFPPKCLIRVSTCYLVLILHLLVDIPALCVILWLRTSSTVSSSARVSRTVSNLGTDTPDRRCGGEARWRKPGHFRGRLAR